MTGHDSAGDLVQVMVPRHLVVEVYRLISDRTGPASVRPGGGSPGGGEGLPDDWSVSLLRRMYSESPKNMRALLDALADRAGETVTATELIEVLSAARGDQAGSSVLGGTLGAFGRRVSNRYGQECWPFEARWDEDSREVHYKMSPAVATVIRDV